MEKQEILAKHHPVAAQTDVKRKLEPREMRNSEKTEELRKKILTSQQIVTSQSST